MNATLYYKIGLAVVLLILILPKEAISQPPLLPSPTPLLSLRVVVNSNQDGAVQADDVVTLREAIAIVNGTLPVQQLSASEKTQVTPLNANNASRIEFNLPQKQTTIRLVDVLPPLATPGLVIDGSTQPGYDASKSATPIVAITPATDKEVFRGFTVATDKITIRGLSIYGFTSRHGATASTPPADIFIGFAPYENRMGASKMSTPRISQPPQNVVIENNWLGIPPNASMPSITSAFGVSVFNGVNTTIRRNRIANHDGSGIITAVRAENLQIIQNIIQRNGFAGMPDAIRLEGIISNAQVTANLIQDNAGSAVYLFKPEGLVKIHRNNINRNGRQLQRAAIYLMGNNHEVLNNKITEQSGPGIVVAAYPQSKGNRIQNNQFAKLQGLSIDLVAQQNVGVKDYQQGDGANPITDSYQRRRKTGNFGIDAPRFLSPEFFIDQKKATVTFDGVATPGSVVQIYRVREDTDTQGPLNEVITTVNVDKTGRFSFTLGNLKAGERLSAIAIHPQYGTSEPAMNAVIRSIDGNSTAN
ncbi:right-handed parallel beta-helix repeat-containing protein [Mastigocladopsis repens]|uniref:right-handed parallel beta-helix repeat-containing protein n=1 Tax=Mastigocladopsis repens TaxID=221287 RepID=UPI0002E4F3AC|nr:right-handed parallel beta-helix repeat-containing protein [Mastigocladopsis repens]